MGTHPNAPSHLLQGNTPLKQILTQDSLAQPVFNKYGGDLPFLFKVLSVGTALSIQAHPDKALAAELHAKYPSLYKDSNHKPEMAIALTRFEAFIGFRPIEEIARMLAEYPEFAAAVGEDVALAFTDAVSLKNSNAKDALKTLFAALMRQDATIVQDKLSALVARIAGSSKELDLLVIRLSEQYPGDCGCFCAFLLNVVHLDPGHAIFLAANEPHAYLSGDCVECMATSDNVVRSGLTPKFKDVDTLVAMLTYSHGPADAQILLPTPFSPATSLYNPPIDEFSVFRISLSPSIPSESHPPINGPSIVIVTQGHGRILDHTSSSTVPAPYGSVFFIAANSPISFFIDDSISEMTLYRAYCVVE